MHGSAEWGIETGEQLGGTTRFAVVVGVSMVEQFFFHALVKL
jgi:hypothetical protein